MKRGEVWTLAGGGDFVSKPRPVIIIQDDHFEDLESVTICPLTTNMADSPLIRPVIEPSPLNGLDARSRVMADKITTVRRIRLRTNIGRVDTSDMTALSRAVLVFLGFANDTQPRPSPSAAVEPDMSD